MWNADQLRLERASAMRRPEPQCDTTQSFVRLMAIQPASGSSPAAAGDDPVQPKPAGAREGRLARWLRMAIGGRLTPSYSTGR
jgi:hypothetical protein